VARPKCLECDTYYAKPNDYFCSQKCAAKFGNSEALAKYEHCDRHGRWVITGGRCDDCEEEELDEEAEQADL
jgi:hypothetical protein